MAKAKTSSPTLPPTELNLETSKFKENLQARIEIGKRLLEFEIITSDNYEQNKKEYRSWTDYNSELLKHSFNNEHNEYKKSYDDTASLLFGTTGKKTIDVEIREFKAKIAKKIENLERLRDKADLLKTSLNVMNEKNKSDFVVKNKSEVFIVHGHDEEAKIKTARFIEHLGMKPIILHEQSSASMTIIEKIENYSNVGFGIVLYTGCDMGAVKNDTSNLKFRARQNVVFEHGYLIGKIGRKNVCALVKGDVETPNDISGIVFVKMDEHNAWHIQIARELRNSGYDIDMNDLLK